MIVAVHAVVSMNCNNHIKIPLHKKSFSSLETFLKSGNEILISKSKFWRQSCPFCKKVSSETFLQNGFSQCVGPFCTMMCLSVNCFLNNVVESCLPGRSLLQWLHGQTFAWQPKGTCDCASCASAIAWYCRPVCCNFSNTVVLIFL